MNLATAMMIYGYSPEDADNTAAIVHLNDAGQPEVAAQGPASFTPASSGHLVNEWDLVRHPEGGCMFLSLQADPAHPSFGTGRYSTHIVATRIYFTETAGGYEVVTEEPVITECIGYDSFQVMTEFVHLHRLNDNSNASGVGYQLRWLKDLALLHQGTHAADFNIVGTINAHAHFAVRNTFYVYATPSGSPQWLVGMKINPSDGSRQVFDLAGGPPVSSPYSEAFYQYSSHHRAATSQVDPYAVFGQRSAGSSDQYFVYEAQLIDENGRNIEVPFPILDPSYRDTAEFQTLAARGIHTSLWAFTENAQGQPVATWYGSAPREVNYPAPSWWERVMEVNEFWGSFVIPDSGDTVDPGITAGYPLDSRVLARPNGGYQASGSAAETEGMGALLIRAYEEPNNSDQYEQRPRVVVAGSWDFQDQSLKTFRGLDYGSHWQHVARAPYWPVSTPAAITGRPLTEGRRFSRTRSA